MKEDCDYNRTITVESLDGGFVYENDNPGSLKGVYKTFTEVVNAMAFDWDLIGVEEEIKLTTGSQPAEKK